MGKDGVTSAGHEDHTESEAICFECMFYKPWCTAKQARSAARYHAFSTGHEAIARIVRELHFKKGAVDDTNG